MKTSKPAASSQLTSTLWHCSKLARRALDPRDCLLVSEMTFTELAEYAVDAYAHSADRGDEVRNEILRRLPNQEANVDTITLTICFTVAVVAGNLLTDKLRSKLIRRRNDRG